MNPVITTPLHTEKAAAPFTKHSVQRSWQTFSAFAALVSVATTILTAVPNSVHAEPTPPNAAQLKIEERALRIYAARSYLNELRRAERVSYSLLQAATPYCVNRRKYSLGIPPISISDLPADFQLGFAESVGSDRHDSLRRFMHVHAFSPAARGGVQEGDVLLSITDGATGRQTVPGWVFNRPASALVSNAPMTLEVERKKTKVLLTPVPQLICDVQPKLLQTDKLVARVDSGVLSISTGLLRFVPGDDELAWLLANELIHDQFRLARADKTKRTSSSTTATDSPYPPNQEYEADYLSAYLVVAANFNLVQANDIWRRLASSPSNKSRGDVASRHPLSPTRSFYLSSVVEEIRRKNQTGERVVPNDQATLPISRQDFSVADPTNSGTVSVPFKQAIEENSKLRSITNIPFIDNVGVAGYQRFLETPLRPRAFAIGPVKKTANASAGAWSYKTGANATADALAHCSLLARGPCYLYAIDDQVVWNPETAQDQPEIKQASAAGVLVSKFPSATNFASIEDLSAVPLPESEISRYRAFLEKPSPRAFVITQRGLGRYWVGLAAMHDALAYCARLDEPCWLYAVNDAVVWSKDSAKRISSRDQLPSETEEAGLLEK